MTNNTNSDITRRGFLTVASAAGLGSVLASATGFAAGAPTAGTAAQPGFGAISKMDQPPVGKVGVEGSGLLNIRAFGAVGDGKTDDTLAIQSALDQAGKTQGTVFVPEGIYCVSELRMPPYTGIEGRANWRFGEFGGSILRLADDKAKCLLNLTGAYGASVVNLCMDGKAIGTGIHGVMINKPDSGRFEDTPRIDGCRIGNFSGDGIHFQWVWCFSVRHSQMFNNRGCGLRLNGWDGFVLDNWFSGNGEAGFGAYEASASVTMTGNRIEWNRGGGIHIEGGNHYNITGNYIDRSGSEGICLVPRGSFPCFTFTITGNIFYRSGKPEWTKNDAFSCHARLEGAHGVVFSGNSLCAGQDDGSGQYSPLYGISIANLKNCIIKDNTLHLGALREILHDLGGHEEGVIIKDNPGCVFKDTSVTPFWESKEL